MRIRPAARLAAIAAALILFLPTLLVPAASCAQVPARASTPGAAALSPDGTLVAWTLRTRDGETLRITTVSDPHKDTPVAPAGATACSSTQPIWSPDGQTLAFTSDCPGKADKSDQEQIFLWSKATATVKQLTHLKGNIEQPAWSPDGASIAFLFVENATRSAGALDAMKPWDGVIGEDGVEVQRVYNVNVATGAGEMITPPQLHVYEFTWNPTAPEIAYIAAPPPGENTWWVAKLYTSAKNHAIKIALDPTTVPGPLHGLQIAVPRFSPNGKRIALIGGLMSDQGSTGGDIWVVNADGSGTPTDITPSIDGTPCFEAWLSNTEIGFIEDRRGHTLTVDYDVAKRAELIASDLGEVSLSGGAIKDAVTLSRNADYAYIKSGYTLAPEVWVNLNNKDTQLTHLNDALKPTTKVESVEWTNEAFHVQGWLIYPANYDPAKRYPLIVTVHGGPSASVGSRWPTGTGYNWSQRGYFELLPNPRGSFGQGEAFVQANIKDFGYGDLRDILAGVDALEKRLPIDDHRLGLTGWSYGGFMSMFAETQTNRFAAIVAGAGISDWKSYYGENSIDQWMIPFFGASVYDDPAVYAKSSAIEFIKNSKTPMLIIVGDRDGECPAPQSFEMWHALRDLGVKTQLVIYPNEGHGFRNPDHIKDRAERTAKWFAENMPEARK